MSLCTPAGYLVQFKDVDSLRVGREGEELRVLGECQAVHVGTPGGTERCSRHCHGEWRQEQQQEQTHLLTPLRNSSNRLPSTTLKTLEDRILITLKDPTTYRMTVPLSEAVASLLPLGLKAMAARLRE